MQQIELFLDTNLTSLHMPNIRTTDIVEILIIAFLVYHILVWAKNTRIWSLMKGIVIIVIFVLLAALFNMTTILWIVQNVFSIAVIAIVVVLQPELRKALEQLGRKNIFSSLLPFDSSKNSGRFSDKTVNEITRACIEMAKVRTGALIVIEQNHSLIEYERTGIDVDGIVTSQLLINIFEHNTPLHDGAVVIRNGRVAAAACFLPLTENKVSMELGTRHRAAIGASEVSDANIIVVSEETGYISLARGGILYRNITPDELKNMLTLSKSDNNSVKKKIMRWKGRRSDDDR